MLLLWDIFGRYLWGCNCCNLLPSELHSPVLGNIVMIRELHFFPPKPPAFSIFVLIPVAESTTFPRFVVGPSAALARGEQQWEETGKSCHCTISSNFYKTSGTQSIAFLMSHSSRKEHWNVHYLKPRRHALAFIVTVEIFLYSKLLRRNIDSFIQNNDTQNCWITFPEHLS